MLCRTQSFLNASESDLTSAASLWIEMGQPQYLLPKQVAQLKVASQLNAQVYRCRTANPLIAQQTMPFSVANSTTIVFNFTVEPQALINIILL